MLRLYAPLVQKTAMFNALKLCSGFGCKFYLQSIQTGFGQNWFSFRNIIDKLRENMLGIGNWQATNSRDRSHS
jgi:hypothetical protein